MNDIPATFSSELRNLINRYSRENRSNTPDLILAQYVERSLEAFDIAVQEREAYYGRWKPEFELYRLKTKGDKGK